MHSSRMRIDRGSHLEGVSARGGGGAVSACIQLNKLNVTCTISIFILFYLKYFMDHCPSECIAMAHSSMNNLWLVGVSTVKTLLS